MKKILILIVILLIALLGFNMYQNSQQADLNDYHANKIQNLERELDGLEDSDVVIEIEDDMEEEGDHDDADDYDEYAETMEVKFPVEYGDDVNYVYVGANVPKSPAVLNAAYNALFNAPSMIEVFDGVTGRNAAPGSNLDFDSVAITDGVARVDLSGTFYTMEMGNRTFRNQINKTAFQYGSVDTVLVFLNGEAFDWCDYDESGGEEGPCAEGPQFWIDLK